MRLGDPVDELADEIELVRGANHEFNQRAILARRNDPVFFGTALANFGVREMLNYFVEWAPAPCHALPTSAKWRHRKKVLGLYFKIQTNIWILSTATVSPLCACARGRTAKV